MNIFIISFLGCLSFNRIIAKIIVASISDVHNMFAILRGIYLYAKRRLQLHMHINIPHMLGASSFFKGTAAFIFDFFMKRIMTMIIAVKMDPKYTIRTVITGDMMEFFIIYHSTQKHIVHQIAQMIANIYHSNSCLFFPFQDEYVMYITNHMKRKAKKVLNGERISLFPYSNIFMKNEKIRYEYAIMKNIQVFNFFNQAYMLIFTIYAMLHDKRRGNKYFISAK
jgi:hypothetical protein